MAEYTNEQENKFRLLIGEIVKDPVRRGSNTTRLLREFGELVDDFRSDIKITEQEKDECEEQAEELERQIDFMEDEIQEKDGRIEELEETITDKDDKIAELETALEDKEAGE